MSLLWIIVIVLVVLAVMGAPRIGIWDHAYGWWPSGLGAVVVIVLLVLLLSGRL